jgi:hypothetical protein
MKHVKEKEGRRQAARQRFEYERVAAGRCGEHGRLPGRDRFGGEYRRVGMFPPLSVNEMSELEHKAILMRVASAAQCRRSF